MLPASTVRTLSDALLQNPLIQGERLSGLCYYIMEYAGDLFLRNGAQLREVGSVVALPLKGYHIAVENPYFPFPVDRPQPYHGACARAVGFPITIAWHGRQVMIAQGRTVTDKSCLAGFTADQSAKITDTPVIGWYFHAALKIVALEHGLPMVFVFDPTLFPDTPLQYSRDWMDGIERRLSPSGEVSSHNEQYFNGKAAFMEHIDASRAGILPPLKKPSWQHVAIEPEYAYDPCLVHAPVWMHLRTPEERTERIAGIEDVLAAGRAVETLLQIRQFSRSIEQSALGL